MMENKDPKNSFIKTIDKLLSMDSREILDNIENTPIEGIGQALVEVQAIEFFSSMVDEQKLEMEIDFSSTDVFDKTFENSQNYAGYQLNSSGEPWIQAA